MAEPIPPPDAPKPPATPAATPAAATPAATPAAAAPATPAAAKPAAAKPAAPAKPGAAKPAAKAPAAPAEIAAPTMKAEIRARLRKGRPSRFEVSPAGAVLGRDDAAAVAIPLDGVSREHARIQWNGRGWWIEDLKSTNGTFVNGEKVAREKLQHLDVIGLGRNADIVFLLRAITEAAPAARQGITRAALTDAEGAVHEIPMGELTLGRSVACNVVADVNAVSKVHARIDRSSDQLLVEDLSSSNGTFVNGTRVRTAVLRDGDTLDLAGKAKFKVVVEQGEVSASGVFRAPQLEKAAEDKPKFSGDWKTRYEWDPAELAAIAAAAAGQRPPELDKKGQPEPPAGPKHVVQGAARKPVEGGKPTSPAVLQPKAAGAAKPPIPAAAPSAPAPVPAAGPAPKPAAPAAAAASSAEKVVPRPVKSEPPAPPAGSPPAVRPPSPAGSDPASTPDQPKLRPSPSASTSRPPAAPPVVAPAPAPVAPKPASARPAVAPPPEPVSEYAATLAEMPAPALARPPAVTVKPRPIVAARFKSDKFAFAVTDPGRFDVGRSASVPLRVDHTTVSRRHAALTLSEDRAHVIVEDLGAANGTRVNGADLKGTRELQDGDTLELGEVRLTVSFDR
jgi:pSer/pThr/pTyr-binding forkhead associated (FHA) protein